jgi:hypothetical protein
MKAVIVLDLEFGSRSEDQIAAQMSRLRSTCVMNRRTKSSGIDIEAAKSRSRTPDVMI